MHLYKLLPILALAAAPVCAQDVHFGFQAGISAPQGDLKDLVDDKIGFTIGGNLGLEFQGGHVLRPRVDFTQHKGEPASGVDTKNTTIFVGADYNYFVSGRAGQGFYVIGGLGYANTKIEVSVSGLGSGDKSEGAVAFAIGAGYQFTPLIGMELRYNSTHPDIEDEAYKNDALTAAITFRF